MKKKGFTLIELLAVIVILAIIALILMPKISDIIMSAKKATFKRNVEGILESAKYYTIESDFNNIDNLQYPIEFTCDGAKCKNENNELTFKGAVPKNGKVTISEEGIISANMLCDDNFCGSGTKGNIAVVDISNIGDIDCYTKIGRSWDFEYLDDTNDKRYHEINITCDGMYKLEAWGASGGTMEETNNIGGAGGYTSGNIELTSGTTLFINIGGQGSNNVIEDPTSTGGYNGGGGGSYSSRYGFECAGGGGATDIRLISNEIDDLESWKSRIMVAAGGGGSCNDRTFYIDISESYGGAGGGLNGYDGYSVDFDSYDSGMGATQTMGGESNYTNQEGQFFQGCNSPSPYDDRAGGGGGYYGGSCGYSSQAAGGGSSYISGYAGCDAIASTSSIYGIDHTGSPEHYSGKVFTNARMIDGKGCDWSTGVALNCGVNQPQPNGVNAVGHIGNGYARITYLGY